MRAHLNPTASWRSFRPRRAANRGARRVAAGRQGCRRARAGISAREPIGDLEADVADDEARERDEPRWVDADALVEAQEAEAGAAWEEAARRGALDEGRPPDDDGDIAGTAEAAAWTPGAATNPPSGRRDSESGDAAT